MAENNPKRWQSEDENDYNRGRHYRGSEYGHEYRQGSHFENDYGSSRASYESYPGNYYGAGGRSGKEGRYGRGSRSSYGNRDNLSGYNQGSYRRGINPDYGQHSYGNMSGSRHRNPQNQGLENSRGYGFNREDYFSSEGSERRNRYNYGRQGNYGDHGRVPYGGNPYGSSESKGVEGFQNYGEYEQRGPFKGRGPKNYRRSDERISEDINDRLSDDPFIDASEIMAQVNDSEVILIGTVDNRYEKRRAEDLAESVSGVLNVENRLRVRPSGSPDSSSETGRDFRGAENDPITQSPKPDKKKNNI